MQIDLSTITEINNIRIYLYPKDHNPPHVHCYKGGYSAVIDIRTGIVVVGDMRSADSKIVKEWVIAHRDELLSMWKKG